MATFPALERGIPAEKFDQFVYQTAPASARNSIMNEMVQNSKLSVKAAFNPYTCYI